MSKLKPIICQSILASFKEVACQGYSSSYCYFHSVGYRTQGTSDIKLTAKVILFHGYIINCQGDIILHLLFMDDLKLLVANDNQLASMIKIVNKFSEDIEMSFGVDNCKKLTIQRGKILQMENI